jgi:hypothetical protein
MFSASGGYINLSFLKPLPKSKAGHAHLPVALSANRAEIFWLRGDTGRPIKTSPGCRHRPRTKFSAREAKK